jgi:hypothetical protein
VCGATGKTRHLTLGDANQALARQRGFDERPGDLHAFHCAECDGFHLGHGGRHGRHFDSARRSRGGPRLSGTARLRRELGEAMARGDTARAKEIVALMQDRRGE